MSIAENRFLVFDTETMGVSNRVIYDIGYYIVNRRGHVFTSRRFLVREIITNPRIMTEAFYHNKIYSNYLEMIDNSDSRLIHNWSDIQNEMREDINLYNVNTFAAYNLAFDMSAINATNKATNCSRLLTQRPVLLDLWLFSCLYLFNTRYYKEMAKNNNWVSDAGNYRTTAEHAYRFITLNADYKEPHTALEDAAIESEILNRLLNKKKKIPYNVINPHSWKIPNAA